MNLGKCREQQLMAVKLLSGTPVCASEADARGEHDAVNRSCEGLFMFESDRGSSVRFTHIAFITVPAAPVILKTFRSIAWMLSGHHAFCIMRGKVSNSSLICTVYISSQLLNKIPKQVTPTLHYVSSAGSIQSRRQ